MGQTHISNGPGDNDSVYFTKQYGTSFWVDIASNLYSGQGTPTTLELPNPNGSIDQDINENVVAGMMWSLWASSNAQTPQSLGDSPMYKTIESTRLTGGMNRGYHTVDFVDYLDAMKCEGLATGTQISEVTTTVGYPYDNQEICP